MDRYRVSERRACRALRFARTDLYDETVCLLNVRPLHDSIVIEAAKVTNLVPGGKLFEVVNPGAGGAAAQRLAEFADGCAIVAYDDALVRRIESTGKAGDPA